MAKNILIVDDNPGCTEIYKIRFETAGYKVAVAFTAEKALEMIAHSKPDVVLLDLMLPQMQGDELLDKLKNDSSTKEIKVAIITAMNLTPEQEKKIKNKADDVMLKIGTMPKTIVERVDKLLV